MADDDMVDEHYVENLCRLAQLARDLHVRRAWRGIAALVAMYGLRRPSRLAPPFSVRNGGPIAYQVWELAFIELPISEFHHVPSR
jgi:hypothetical protein